MTDFVLLPDRTGIQQLPLPGADRWPEQYGVLQNSGGAALPTPMPGANGSAAPLDLHLVEQLSLFSGPPWP